MAKIKNRARLRAKLRALPTEIKKHIIPALEKAAQEIVDMQHHLAPFKSGDLRNSIDWTWGAVPKRVAFLSLQTQPSPQSKNDLFISIYAGNEKAFYARFVEFGTRATTKGEKVTSSTSRGKRTMTASRTFPGTRAQPFFFPAYRALKKSVKNRINRATNKALKAVAAMQGGLATSGGD